MDIIKVLSIDLGIINLGYVFAEITGQIINVIECNRVNITHMRHTNVSYCDCKLHHEYCVPDYVDHFIQEHLSLFEQANIILIERQPPVGITNVQDLIFSRFRNKVKLISPNSIHKYFKMTRCEYEVRKLESEKITSIYLENFKNFNNNCRRHDISDAMLMIIYYSQTRVIKKKPIVIDYLNFFERFRFNG